MPNIGPMELIIIFAIVLLVFGPSALPKIMGGVGKGIREFRDAVRGISTDLEDDRNRASAKPNDPAQDAHAHRPPHDGGSEHRG